MLGWVAWSGAALAQVPLPPVTRALTTHPVTLSSVTVPPVTLPAVPLPPVTLPGITLPGRPSPAPGHTAAGPTKPVIVPAPSAPPTARPVTTTLTTHLRPVHRAQAPTAAPRAAGGTRSAPAGPGATIAKAPAALALRSARDLSAPLGVAGLVGVFLVVQGWLDSRDPKLVDAPVGTDDDVIQFA